MERRGHGDGTISKRENGTWWARITVGTDENGKQIRKAFYGKTRKEVQQKLTEAIKLVNQGEYVEPSRIPLYQWVETWLAEKKLEVRPTAFYVLEHAMKKHIVPALGQYALRDISTDIVQRFLNDLVASGLTAQSAVDVVMKMLKPCLDKAVVNRMLYRNPCDNIAIPRIKRNERPVLTREEQHAFVNAAYRSATTYDHIFLLILATGLRIGEALALTWADVDFARQCLSVTKANIRVFSDGPSPRSATILGPTKTASSVRTVPLLPATVTMLSSIFQVQTMKMGMPPESNDFVFWSPANPRKMCTRMPVQHAFDKLRKATNINPAITVHGLRHPYVKRKTKKFANPFGTGTERFSQHPVLSLGAA